MTDIEIPLGKRTKSYRFFELLPAILSYGAVILLIVLAIVNPLISAAYLLLVATTVLIKALFLSFHMIQGRIFVTRAEKIDWHKRLSDLEDAKKSIQRSGHSKLHYERLTLVAENEHNFPKPSDVYNAVIIATYNEPYEVLRDTMNTLVETHYDKKRLIIVLAYEERGGIETEKNAIKLQHQYSSSFYGFEITRHPSNLPGEVIGKGGNITYAGKYLATYLSSKQILSQNVIVTTLDSDNRPHKSYFDYVTYEYITHENRKHMSYQPVSLFLNNIWDVPAPMRVVATGNSYWNIISSVRPHTLRNFASHSQSMDALIEMDFWSTKTIVEDGHQYWRSYFHFDGDYDVLPIFVPIYQDAVMSDTYVRTLKAQFVQLRRWAYGASDIAYVATRIFSRKRRAPLIPSLTRLIRLVDGHVTLACIPILITFGGWLPLVLNSEATRSVTANQLPEVLGIIQRIAMLGLVVTIFLTFKMLPPRPARYKRRRTFGMLAQWVLMPFTALLYSSASAYNSQTRLFLGKYLDVFEVTEKATVVSVQKAKQRRKRNGKWKFPRDFLKNK